MPRAALAIAALVVIAGSVPAWADKIDGDWCSGKGKHFSIDGPKIITPAGKTVEGNYSRHAYAYEPPADDPEHGQVILMQLLNEETVRLYRQHEGRQDEPEIWHRCQVVS